MFLTVTRPRPGKSNRILCRTVSWTRVLSPVPSNSVLARAVCGYVDALAHVETFVRAVLLVHPEIQAVELAVAEEGRL